MFALASLAIGAKMTDADGPGIDLFGLISTAAASPATAAPNAEPAAIVCPPASIDGTIGSGSSDWPFSTGQQTSRLFRNSVESTCGTPKPTPNLTDNGVLFRYDAFLFSNTAHIEICVTVITTPGANSQLLAAAYLDGFNPANVQQNYLGDAGTSDGTRAFSFIVPAQSNFVVVQSRVNNAANPTSLAYSFRVLGVPGCSACPPTGINGTISGNVSGDYPAAQGNQSGRLFRDAVASTCEAPKATPTITDSNLQFAYAAYTFLNRGAETCVTVNATAGGANQLLTAAYLDRFNPFDVQENYLGDAGNSDPARTFSFTVPAKRSFVIVVSRVNNAGNPTSLEYNFGLSGLSGCNCVATLSKSSESFAANGGTGSVNVTIPQGCDWGVSNFGPAFVSITNGSSGTGNGTLNYSVEANALQNPRTGVFAIAGKPFQVHQGMEFADVPPGSQFYTEIGKLAARRVTLGCGTGVYCPNDSVTREQMAAFIIRALGQTGPPIPQQQRFGDVPPQNTFYAFIDQMAVRQITLGCSTNPALYCPSGSVTREQMAAFLIRAKGEFNPPNPPNQRFIDVPPSNPFYNFIDRMAVLGITQGCSANPPAYCPASLVTRAQMAAFLVRAFGL
jgi:hypothetical protein